MYYDVTKPRSKNYIGTVTDINDPMIQIARKTLRANKFGGIRIRARLGKDNPAAPRYHRGGDLFRMSCVDYRKEHGVRWDIYRKAA